MKAAARVNDPGPTGRGARQLDRRFDRFAAAQRKERDRQTRHPSCELGAELGRVAARSDVQHVRRIAGQRARQPFDEPRRIVAERHRAEARKKIEVTPPVRIPQLAAARALENASETVDAEQLHERRIHVLGVALGDRMELRLLDQ